MHEIQQFILNKIHSNHNAGCPCCLSTWEFDFDYAAAYFTKREKDHFLSYGYVHVICEDCENLEEIDELTEELFHEGIVFTFVTSDRD